MNAGARLLRLQRRIYESLRSEAESLLGPANREFRRYAEEFSRDLHLRNLRAAKRTQLRQLVREVRFTDVTFVADYHTYPQAQRTALRLLRESFRPGERWAVGLEMIGSQHQKLLDRFQAGRLGLRSFLKAVNYDSEWGFAWSQYEPILAWARDNGAHVLALNQPGELPKLHRGKRRDSDLHSRDRWAAGVLTDYFENARAPTRALVLYGEMHVATAHLPTQLESVSSRHLGSPLKSLVIHQNDDDLYWKLSRTGKIHHPTGIRLRSGCYCVFSGTPWGKLQSLVDWLEGGRPEATEDDHLAHLSTMKLYCEVISEFFGTRAPSFDSVHLRQLRTADDARFVERMARAEAPWVRSMLAHGRSLYLPKSQTAYLPSPSQNALAELAALHLYHHYHQGDIGKARVRGTADFMDRVTEEAFGFLGSLVINPKRKCDLPGDHAARLRHLERGSAEHEARSLASRVIRSLSRERPRLPAEVAPRRRADSAHLIEAARYVGQWLGKKTHRALIEGRINPARIAELVERRDETCARWAVAVAGATLESSKRHVL